MLCATTLVYFLTFGRINDFESWLSCFLEIAISSLNQMRSNLIFNLGLSSVVFLICFSVI